MRSDHLTDEQIQAYLDGQMAARDKTPIDIHLHACARCLHELMIYRDLYSSLEQDSLPELSADFADRVVSKLKSSGQTWWDKMESGFIVSLTLITLATSLYFVNPLPWLTNTGMSLLNSLPAYGSSLLEKLNGNLPFVLVALLIFFLIELFDKKLLKPRL